VDSGLHLRRYLHTGHHSRQATTAIYQQRHARSAAPRLLMTSLIFLVILWNLYRNFGITVDIQFWYFISFDAASK